MQKKDRNSCIRIDRDADQINKSQSFLTENRDYITKNTAALNLLGNQVRLSIVLLLLEETKLCVCDLAEILEMKIPAVSQHLRKLKDGNILYSTRDGTVLYYAVKMEYISFVTNILNRELV
jgi:Predicted transcriptional regulators